MVRHGMLTSSTPHLLRSSIEKVVTKREGIAGLEDDGVDVPVAKSCTEQPCLAAMVRKWV